jgi:NAD-dependent dihydropyrimidine dehydrogenase PreA subunit
MIKLNRKKCNGCGVCVESCPFGVLAIQAKKAVIVKPDACRDCHACVKVCPNQAIKYINEQKR